MMKLKLYPAIGIAVTLTLLTAGWAFWQRFQIEISSVAPDTVPVLQVAPAQSVVSQPEPIVPPEVLPSLPNSTLVATRQGALRISNRSEHPLRVALLLKSAKVSSAKVLAPYEAPAHWDFAPGEGGEQGLLVSLPNRQVMVKKGDVLVAFAQDGSQRYWGPYVINETPTPLWNSQKAEWELVLED
jgi:hypothetical protein